MAAFRQVGIFSFKNRSTPNTSSDYIIRRLTLVLFQRVRTTAEVSDLPVTYTGSSLGGRVECRCKSEMYWVFLFLLDPTPQ